MKISFDIILCVLFKTFSQSIILVGLITPNEVISEVLKHKNDIPINSLEGFIRQVIGWREYIRGIYHYKGVQQRNSNFFDFKRKMPKSFYDGSTGVFPFDNCIKKVLQNAYSNHIEINSKSVRQRSGLSGAGLLIQINRNQ